MAEPAIPSLWQASAALGEVLEESRAHEARRARDDDAQLLVVAGTNALAAIDALARDRSLWKAVGRDVHRLSAKDLAPLYRLLDGGWPKLMAELGYVPPPPSEKLATDLLGALVRLRATPLEPGALRQAADEARAELLEVADVLRGVLAAAPEIPPALRARSLRGPLREAQRAMVAAGPLAVAAGALVVLPGGAPVAALGAAALTLAGPGLEAARGSRRRRSVQGWQLHADVAMDDLAGSLDGDGAEKPDAERAMKQVWIADGALHGLAVTDPADAAAVEAQELLHEVRQALAKDGTVPVELRRAVREWKGLSRGWVAEYRMHRQTVEEQSRLKALARRRPVRFAEPGTKPGLVGDKPPEGEEEPPPEEEPRPELERGR